MNENTTRPSAASMPTNAAIRRCCLAEKRSRRDSRLKRLSAFETTILADEAYRKAMPELVGYENIRDFIACAGHGMVIGALTSFQASKLLYAAQIALSAFARQPRPGRFRTNDPSSLPPHKSEEET